MPISCPPAVHIMTKIMSISRTVKHFPQPMKTHAPPPTCRTAFHLVLLDQYSKLIPSTYLLPHLGPSSVHAQKECPKTNTANTWSALHEHVNLQDIQILPTTDEIPSSSSIHAKEHSRTMPSQSWTISRRRAYQSPKYSKSSHNRWDP
jgi:hypothetical protein